jgi:hypothetical protein
VETLPTGYAAGTGSRDIHSVSLDQRGDLGANLYNICSYLVATACRKRCKWMEPLEKVEVTPTDQTCSVSEDDLIWSWLRNLDLEPLELIWTNNNRGWKPERQITHIECYPFKYMRAYNTNLKLNGQVFFAQIQ